MTPIELVNATKKRKLTWYESISEVDRQYVRDVVILLKERPAMPLQPIVDALIEQLQLPARRTAVRDTLRSMIRA